MRYEVKKQLMLTIIATGLMVMACNVLVARAGVFSLQPAADSSPAHSLYVYAASEGAESHLTISANATSNVLYLADDQGITLSPSVTSDGLCSSITPSKVSCTFPATPTGPVLVGTGTGTGTGTPSLPNRLLIELSSRDDVFIAETFLNLKVTVNGSDGNDSLSNRADGQISINGGAGDDTVLGGTNRDNLSGQNGSDMISGGDGTDSIQGGAGEDQLVGGPGEDIITGGPASDVVRARDDVVDSVICDGSPYDDLLEVDSQDVLNDCRAPALVSSPEQTTTQPNADTGKVKPSSQSGPESPAVSQLERVIERVVINTVPVPIPSISKKSTVKKRKKSCRSRKQAKAPKSKHVVKSSRKKPKSNCKRKRSSHKKRH